MKILLLLFLLPALLSAAPVQLLDDLSAWTSLDGKPAVSAKDGWHLEDGTLYRAGKTGDLLSKKLYGDFTLTFEWKIASGTNSGVKYRVTDYGKQKLGMEYQIIDDGVHKDSKDPKRQAATVYALFPANGEKQVKSVGEWNTSKIVARGTKIEHWLNGTLVVSYDTASADFDAAVAASKFKTAEGFGKNAEGKLLIQDHGDPVWYRNMTIDTETYD